MKKNILLVEDESLIALSQKRFLESNGYNVSHIRRAEESIYIFQNFDLILMDIDLGSGMSGITAAYRILEQKEIPIIFLSNKTDKKTLQEIDSMFNFGFIPKNSDKFHLLQTIKTAFKLFQRLSQKNSDIGDLFYKSPIPKLIIDPETSNIVEANDSACQYYGYDFETLTSMKITNINVLSEEEINLEMQKAFTEKRSYFNFTHRLASGSVKQVEVTSKPVFFKGRNLLYSLILDREERENTYKKYEDVFSSMHDGFAIYNAINDGNDFILSDINDAGIKMGNIKNKKHVIGKSIRQIFPKTATKEFPLFQKMIKAFKTGKVQSLSKLQYNDRNIKDLWVETYVHKINSNQIVLIFHDVTKQTNLNNELEKNEDKISVTFDSMGDGVFVVDSKRKITRINKIAQDLINISEKAAIGSYIYDIFKIVDSKTKESVDNPIERVFKTGNIEYLDSGIKLISRSGKEYYISDSAAPIKDVNGNITDVVFIFRDVTQEYERQKRIEINEKNLFTFRERLESIMKFGELAWWEIHLPSGKIVFNKQKAIMLGRDHEDFETYHDFMEFIHPEDKERVQEEVDKLISNEKYQYNLEYRVLHKNGKYIWFKDIGQTLERDESGKAIVINGVAIKIEELKQKENDLVHLMQEMNHRIKNNLSMVKSLVQIKSSAINVDLSDIASQIDSVVLLHQKLYEAETQSTDINMKDYVGSLLKNIFNIYEDDVEVNNFVDESLSFNSKITVNLGLIISELATNAMKYGFNKFNGKKIFSIFLGKDENSYTLISENTGNKFNGDIEDSFNGFGLQIIRYMTMDMEGVISLVKEPHTKIILSNLNI